MTISYFQSEDLVVQYVIAAIAFVVVFFLLWLITYSMKAKVRQLAAKTKSMVDDALVGAISKLRWPFRLVIALYIASLFLELHRYIHLGLKYLALFVGIFYAVKGVQQFIDFAFKGIVEKRQKQDESFDSTGVNLLGKLARGALWVVAVIVLAQNLGLEITALVTGLGIGGIAVALAIENILSDIFASISLYFDKPFQLGDYIQIGEDSGTVMKIGLKSTRLQTLQGEELILSNKELTESRVHNYRRMEKRRLMFSLGVTYETENEKLKRIPQLLRDVIQNIEMIECGSVALKEFGDSAIIFDVVCFVQSKEYSDFVKRREELNYAILDLFSSQGVDMAYPTRRVYTSEVE